MNNENLQKIVKICDTAAQDVAVDNSPRRRQQRWYLIGGAALLLLLALTVPAAAASPASAPPPVSANPRMPCPEPLASPMSRG